MPFVESLNEFKLRMNCPCVWSKDRYLFENGGEWDEPNGRWWDPPTDKWELLKLKQEYYTVVLRREREEYVHFLNSVTEQLAWCKRFPNLPPPSGDAPAQLRAGEERMRVLAEKLREINAELSQSPEAQRERQRKADEQIRDKRLRDFEQAVHARGDYYADVMDYAKSIQQPAFDAAQQTSQAATVSTSTIG